MDIKIAKALAEFEEADIGSIVPKDDLDRVQEFVTDLLVESGKVTRGEATGLTCLLQWGHWAEGHDMGYASGLRRGAPRSSLNGS